MKFFLSASIIMLLVSISFADQKLRVIDSDIKNKGVECDIKVKKKDGKVELVSYTNNDGFAQVDFKCTELEKAIFLPKGDYYRAEERCPIRKTEIYVSSIKYQKTLILNGIHLMKIGDYGSAALAFSEGAARLKKHDKAKTLFIEIKAYEAAGKFLGVRKAVVFDPTQSKKVISPELSKAIKEHQVNSGLEKTGKLDFRTLESLSNRELPKLMFGILGSKDNV